MTPPTPEELNAARASLTKGAVSAAEHAALVAELNAACAELAAEVDYLRLQMNNAVKPPPP